MPATLIELGFITNSSEAALMNQRPDLFANGIYEGILDFFDM
jgi:N-acetylmuramoyl-L-alanine amidase